MGKSGSGLYHYTESGLDNVYLAGGFRYETSGGRRRVVIPDIDGLHAVVGWMLATVKDSLTGKEFRFLRHELLLSQAALAKLLGVTEQSIHRWEAGKTDIPRSAEKLLRMIYVDQRETDRERREWKTTLEFLKGISEREQDLARVTLTRTKDGDAWRLVGSAAA